MAAAFDIVRAHTAKVALPVWLLTSRALGARPSGGSGASAHAGMMGGFGPPSAVRGADVPFASH